MKRYCVKLLGDPKHGQDVSALQQTICGEFQLTDENRQNYLDDAIQKTGNLNPNHKNIRVIQVEVEVEDENGEKKYKTIFIKGKWL